ncbi:MAG: hypothetical protein ABSD50_02820 [Smithella sp.]
MAISRHPIYIKDIEEIRKLFKKEINKTDPKSIEVLQEKLCTKWRLKSPVIPCFGKDKDDFIKVNSQNPIIELNEGEWPNALYMDYSAAIGEYKFVRLQINLTRSNKELLDAFGKIIKTWGGKFPKDRMQRKTIYDKWFIYDKHKSGIPLLKIALELNKKTYPRDERSPAYNEELWPPYKRVHRAYKIAEKIIKSVGPVNISK